MLYSKDGKVRDFPQPDPELLSPPSHNERSSSLSSQTLSDVPSDIIIRSRIKYGSKSTACQAILAEYSKSSTIHGLRYIFEVHRPVYEKLYWVIFMCISCYFAIYLMWDTYVTWLESPVILGFDETLVPVHKIPFPTVTICPGIKIATNIIEFAVECTEILTEIEENGKFENFANLTQEQLERFAAVMQFCDDEVVELFASNLLKDLDVDVTASLIELASKETMQQCKWNRRNYHCGKIFKRVMTDEGVCYQFNGLETEDIYRDPNYISFSDENVIDFNGFRNKDLPKYSETSGKWSLDDGYVDQGLNAYPQHSISSLVRNSLFAFMTGSIIEIDRICHDFKEGYKVFLNSPESVPLTTGNYILVPYNQFILISIIPQYVVSTNDIHDFSPEKRQCYFNDERYLRFFKSYSQRNCQTECLTNFTINECGCAKFWMPKPLNTSTCGLADLACCSEAADEMNSIIANQIARKLIDPDVRIMCDCMPSCNSLDYDYEISTAYYDFSIFPLSDIQKKIYSLITLSRVGIYFKESQFTAVKRTVLFGVSDLVANFGGILGLVMGISSFSIIEIIYFFTVRLFCNLRKRRQIEKKLLEIDLQFEIE